MDEENNNDIDKNSLEDKNFEEDKSFVGGEDDNISKLEMNSLEEEFFSVDFKGNQINNKIKTVDETKIDMFNLTKEEISWENKGTPSIEENKDEDYKGVIGRLYNNSRLQNPYEKNKYNIFKEIFPTTSMEEKGEQKEKDDCLTELKIKKDDFSRDCNIDCEDIRNLNNLFNLQGINIKIHNNEENNVGRKIFTDKNKLNMVKSWIMSIIMLCEIIFSFFILNDKQMIIERQRLIFFLSIAFVLSYVLISTFENIFDRFRLVKITKSFSKSLMQKIFLFLFIVVFVFVVNIVCGMTNLSQVRYFCYWFIPILLSTNLIISTVVYYTLLRSKSFNN